MSLKLDNLNGKVRGVLHIGAYVGEEMDAYQKCNVKNVIFFEPVRQIYLILIQKVGHLAQTYNIALGNFNGQANIYISRTPGIELGYGSGASNSLLKPKKHLTQHPNILFPYIEKVEVRKLNDFIISEKIDINDYNMINIDVQGYELEVFKGATDILPNIDYIVTEVNRDETYENCARIEELDQFLSTYNFVRTETFWAWEDIIWGDALYEKL